MLSTIASKPIAYQGPQSLKGLKIGVTSPGSSTHFMAAYMLVRSRTQPDDASFVATGVTSTAVAAAKRAEIDAIVSSDPMVSLMQSEGLIKIVADTRTRGHAGGLWRAYPGGVVYLTPAFIERNPHRAGDRHRLRARAEMDRRAFARRHRQGDARGLRARQPRGLCARDRRQQSDVFARRPLRSRRGGDRPPGAPVFDPAVAGATVDLSKTHTGSFVGPLPA